MESLLQYSNYVLNRKKNRILTRRFDISSALAYTYLDYIFYIPWGDEFSINYSLRPPVVFLPFQTLSVRCFVQNVNSTLLKVTILRWLDSVIPGKLNFFPTGTIVVVPYRWTHGDIVKLRVSETKCRDLFGMES